MATTIHPTAIVEEGVQLDVDITIGPYALVGAKVKIGKNTEIGAFSQILGNTEIGENCKIYPYAIIGSPPQDLKYKGEETFLIIGHSNIIREFVTINPGTEEGSKTVIGNNNLIMAYSHIAHNCSLGDNNVLANAATLAGYVEIQDRVVIGGLVAIHQFCRIGSFTIIGGCSKVVQDIPPYSLSDGHPAKVRGLNIVGLKRNNFSQESIKQLKKAYKILFFDNHPLTLGQDIVKSSLPLTPQIKYLLDFISSSQRGLAR